MRAVDLDMVYLEVGRSGRKCGEEVSKRMNSGKWCK